MPPISLPRVLPPSLGAERLAGALAVASDLLFPPVCINCRADVMTPHGLCSDCWGDAVFIDSPLCRRCGAAATVSELISSEGLVRASEKTHHMLAFLEAERPYAIQIFGHDAEHMAEAARIAAQADPD